jgi:hypothetical protein
MPKSPAPKTRSTAPAKRTPAVSNAKRPTVPREEAAIVAAGGATTGTPETRTMVTIPSDTPRMSALDAAARVLAEVATPMRLPDLIVAMAERRLWMSPAGKTPAATLSAAMRREIQLKGATARFRLAGKGLFTLGHIAAAADRSTAADSAGSSTATS